MEIWMAFAGILVLGAWAVSQCSLYVYIDYIKDGETDRLRIRVKLFDWLQLYQRTRENLAEAIIEKYIKKILGQKPKQKAQAPHRDTQRVDYKSMLFAHFICRRLICRIKIFSTDASRTAILYGSVYSAGHILLKALMCRSEFASPPEFTVQPQFYDGENTLEFRCICSAKIGNVISMAKQFI